MEDKIILAADPCCMTGDVIPTANVPLQCVEPNPDNCVMEKGYDEFVKLAAVLQESVLHSWQLHLKDRKYSVHIILEEYYDEAFDIIDGLIEHYQGICKCDIVDGSVTSDIEKSSCPIAYFTDLKNYLVKFVNNPNNFSEKTMEIKSDIDDLMRLIDSTLYKLNNLTESNVKSFEEFVYEKFN